MHWFLPLGPRVARRRRGLQAALILALTMITLAGCSLPWQKSGPGTTGAGPAPTAQQVLTTLQKNFAAATSFHITMKSENLGSDPKVDFILRQADGDVVMPDKIRAQASVLLSGQAMTVNLISVAGTQYITDPITGQWRVVKGLLDPRVLTNPQTGLISLAGKLQSVSGPTGESVDGVDCWRVDGLLPASDLTFFTGGGAPAGAMLKTSVWASKSDGLPYRIVVTGIAAPGDSANTTRTFDISKYNENISIVAPSLQ